MNPQDQGTDQNPYQQKSRSKQIPAVRQAMDRVSTGWSDSFCLDLVSLDASNVHHMAYFLYHHQGMIRQLRLYACSLPQQQQQLQQRGRDPPTLENNSNPVAVNLPSCSDNSDAALQQLRAFVQESDYLRKVTFSYCELGNDVLAKLLLRQDVISDSGPAVSPTMTGNSSGSSMVQELDLSRNQLQGTRSGEILGQVLVQEMPHLQKLDLQINPLGPGGILALQSSLDQAARSCTLPLVLQDLNLRCCHLGNEGLNILVDILTDNRHEHFPSLTHLNIAYNHIQGTVGGTALAQLLERRGGIQKLRLSGNALGESGARALAPGLATNKTLEILRLDYCQVGDAGIHAIVDSLVGCEPKVGNDKKVKKNISGLKVLTLHSNGFTSRALPALTRLLNHKESHLEHLNLSTNRYLLAKVDPPPAEAPTEANNTRRSELESSPSSVASLIQDFALAVAHNVILRMLSVYDCGMEDHARAMIFLDNLKRSNTTLESLRIAGTTGRPVGNSNRVLGATEIEAICQGLGRRNQLLSHAATLKGATVTSATIVFGLSRLVNDKDGNSAAFQIVRDKLFFPVD